MKTRNLGKNGVPVSEVALGCWQLGGDWGENISKDKAFEIMQTAIDQGIDFFDTADVYGAGKSEMLIGEFKKSSNVQLRVATKFGRMGHVYPNQYSKASLRQCIEDSLKRLQVETLDLLQLHCIPTQYLREGEIFDWLRQLQQEGLIQAFGASVESVEEALICLEQPGLRSLQVIFNLFRQKLVEELFPQAQAKGVGIIVRLPLASGLLAGKYSLATTFAEDDHRNYNRNGEAFNVGETFAGLPFETGVALTDTLKAQYLPEEMSMAAFSLRWVLDHEAVSCIIPGARNIAQVQGNAAVSDLAALSPDLHQSLAAFYQQSVQQHIRGPY